MCQLLGVSSNKKVDIQFTIREFHHRGKGNPHGWGFAFHQNGDWKIIKEPSSLFAKDIKDEQFKFKSKAIIGHVRFISCGNQTHLNTHPFKINNWAFAHNGTVKGIMKEPQFALAALKPEGQTDSEYAFCYLLEEIGNEPENIKNVLEREAQRIKQYGNFNFLLSDGNTLFAYGDNSLYYVRRKAPFDTVTLIDDQYSVNLEEIKAPEERAILIATKPLTVNEKWKKISGLRIFKEGRELK
ncbi:MAG: class II glutamine amidotransferase [Nitrospirota bacterium]